MYVRPERAKRRLGRPSRLHMSRKDREKFLADEAGDQKLGQLLTRSVSSDVRAYLREQQGEEPLDVTVGGAAGPEWMGSYNL